MTKLLENAFNAAAKLPEIEQNVIGRWLLDEIKADKKWEKLFAGSEDVLEQLAQEALAEHEKGQTKDMDINKL
ncbi:TRAP-type C4-dicarboxylate transport system, periplasmic component [Candidatus Desulfarcum epimagneticum]|uniref:TRAP-type C4-dicarboxylate transport system, periplasmic component n=1 Tax=uncultured Desulfobacteraceae bacterium TaxID=218296 RepID=A0A484HBX5_9BACT|nr:TRAP-type C4-dicarboxylate transport system, periplasmic component [uncultured Desulfobacteraceae bacterium]